MKTLRRFHLRSLLFACWLLGSESASAQTTAVGYQGRLSEAGKPATGLFDMEFKLFDIAEVGAGVQRGDTRVLPVVPVTNGVFAVTLDFGAAVYDGGPLFLEIRVRPGGGLGPYTPLAPRQQVASVPYAIQTLNAGRATTAAIATTVASGAVLQSLNNLKDNVTLLAGTNITITPSGSTLTIASTGGNGGLWNTNGPNTYFNGGNVGIGTNAPVHRLSLSGGPDWTSNGWIGAMDLPNGSALAWRANAAGQRFGMGHANTGFYLFRTASDPATVASPALYDFVINDLGNVGLGLNAPAPGYRLDVNGAVRITPGNGGIQFGSPNAELGMTITPTTGNRADLRFDGSILKLVASAGVVPPSAANGIAITLAGNVGIGTTTPVSKLEIAAQDALTLRGFQPFLTLRDSAFSDQPARIQNVSGGLFFSPRSSFPLGSVALGPPALVVAVGGNVGVGTTTPNAKLRVEGDAKQPANAGGFAKAMAFIDPFLPADRYVVRCYNSQLGAGSSASPCGIGVERLFAGVYRINFGFDVSSRFVSMTPRTSSTGAAGRDGTITEAVGNSITISFGVAPFLSNDSAFDIIVY